LELADLLEYVNAKLGWVFEIDRQEWVFESNMTIVTTSKVEEKCASFYLNLKICLIVSLPLNSMRLWDIFKLK
jgi:hypothetical protein